MNNSPRTLSTPYATGRNRMNQTGAAPKSHSNIELLAQIQLGSQDALEILYDRTAPQALGLATAFLPEPAMAEDVILQAYALVWQQPEKFLSADVSFSCRLLGKVRELAAAKLRGRAAPHSLVKAADLNDECRGAVQPDRHGLSLDSLIASLPDEQRQVIELAYYAGMTCAEISGALGEPSGRICNLAQIGFAGLRERLLETGTHQVIMSRVAAFNGEREGSEI